MSINNRIGQSCIAARRTMSLGKRAAAAGLLLSASSALALAQGGAPIKIVSSVDVSGPAGVLGTDALTGYQFAIEKINAQGGLLGRQVTLDYQDNGSAPPRSVSQAEALSQQGASLLLSPISSGSTLAVSKSVSAKQKIPMCVSVSAAEEITMKDYQPYVFSVAPTTYMLMRAVVARLAKQPFKRYALMVPDYAGGRAAAVRFKEFMKEMNPAAEVVVEEYPKLGATDYTASINKILAAKPDYLWAQVFGGDLMTFAKQGKALGFFEQINNHFMTVTDTDTLKMLGDNVPLGTDAYSYAPFNYLAKSDAGHDFVMQYKAKTGNNPSDWAVVGYECVMSWAQAVKAANSVAADDVMKAIETTPISSLRGALHFGKNDHELSVPVYFGKVVAGKEFGQPVLEVDDVVPASVTLPTQELLEKSRKE